MRAGGALLGGLGTSVALRTFLLFCACALVPMLVLATLAYRAVDAEARASAQLRLMEGSKRYGLLVYERLRQTDALLSELARLHAETDLSAERVKAFTSPYLRVLSVTEGIPANPRDESVRTTHTLSVEDRGGTGRVLVSATFTRGAKSVTVTGEPASSFLWNGDAAEIPEGVTCISRGSLRLRCIGAAMDDPQDADEPQLKGEWQLFLRPYFGAEGWTIQIEQPERTALAGLRSFNAMVPHVAGLTILSALLLSAIQIRRSHRPLTVLTEAARRLSRGRFDAPLALSGRDEYASLANAFNRMAMNLRRQFRILSTFARVDMLILAHTAVDPVIDILLSRMLKLLGCEAAAVLLVDAQRGPLRVRFVRRGAPKDLQSDRLPLPFEVLQKIAGTKSVNRRSAAELAELGLVLPDTPAAQTWYAAPIRVKGSLRGTLLLGFAQVNKGANERSATRYLAGLGRRIAVVLGNEDREQALLRHAYYDSLTGLPNRQLFKDRLDQELARTRRGNSPVSLLFIDLDRFKNVNDSLGHSAGDELLTIVSERLRSLIRECDTLARLGGDEFTIICPDLPGLAAGNLANRILEVLNQPIATSAMHCVVQASIGIALFPRDGASAEALLRNADTAMYRAKATGRGRAVFFEEAMNEQATRRMRLEQRLRVALANGGLSLFFQPKVQGASGRAVGVEALARWNDPAEGAVSPAEFVAIAEETGLIARLGDWVLNTACETLARWRENGLDVGHVAVNVSTHQLRDAGFVNTVARSLALHNLPPHCLELEITESALAAQPEEAAEVLRRIRALGVRIAIDDFGTGYSSMAVLQQWPVDVLKIDRCFVNRCAEDPDAGALAGALIGVASALGKKVVAEGVETPEQAEFLVMHGCELLQGFLFARPMDAEALAAYFTRRPVVRAFPSRSDLLSSAG